MRYYQFFKYIFVTIIVVGLSILLFNVVKKHIFDVEAPYYDKIIDVSKGSVIILEKNEHVVLAGVHIPYEQDSVNYHSEWLEYPKKFLKDKRVKIELIERHRTGSFANYDLVRVYLENGICVNDYLLVNGLAFYDHGYYRGKDEYLKLVEKARKEKRGLWLNENLGLLYVGSKNSDSIHYPECSEVEKIKAENRVEYYDRPPYVHWYKMSYPHDCKYCEEIRKTKSEHLK